MSGNLHRRSMLKFMPADFRLIEYRQPPLKDQYDEWLARLICYAFSVPVTPFVSQVNRATSETMRVQATQEGLVPLKNWVKSALDRVIQDCMGEKDLEFVWVGDDAIDPLQQAQTLNILVSAGIKTREEARAELGLRGEEEGRGVREGQRRTTMKPVNSRRRGTPLGRGYSSSRRASANKSARPPSFSAPPPVAGPPSPSTMPPRPARPGDPGRQGRPSTSSRIFNDAIDPPQQPPPNARYFRALEQNKNFFLTSHSGCGIVVNNGDGAGGEEAAAVPLPPDNASFNAPAPSGRFGARLSNTEPRCPLSTCSCR